jgi:hypothetical protein
MLQPTFECHLWTHPRKPCPKTYKARYRTLVEFRALYNGLGTQNMAERFSHVGVSHSRTVTAAPPADPCHWHDSANHAEAAL